MCSTRGVVSQNAFDVSDVDHHVRIEVLTLHRPRYIVGVHVHTTRIRVLARELMEQIFAVHRIPNVVHADRGTSMTSKTVAALLADLEVTRSHSRPRVSNDNPFSDYAGCVIMPSPIPNGRVRTGRRTAAG